MSEVTPFTVQTVDQIAGSFGLGSGIKIDDYSSEQWDIIDAVRDINSGLADLFGYLGAVKFLARKNDLSPLLNLLKPVLYSRTKDRLMAAAQKAKQDMVEGKLDRDAIHRCMNSRSTPVFLLLNATHDVDDILRNIAAVMAHKDNPFTSEGEIFSPYYTHLVCDAAEVTDNR